MEIIAVIFSLWSVYLAIKVNIWTWLIGLIGILAYFIIFTENHLYAQVVLQVIFFGQSIYGWIYWYSNEKKRPSFTIKPLRLIIDLAVVGVLTPVLALILRSTNDPQPIFDAVTVLLSILATWYMIKKCIFNWLVWCIADVFFIIMFLNQKMYWSAGLYTIFALLSIKGVIQWRKKNIEMV
jgi:nicotinamide mononucleotide transporter